MIESVEVGIVAHPDRKDQALWLRDQVAATALSWDMHGNLGATHNHRQVWTYLRDSPADWCCVLEDDALPVEDFTHQLPQVLTACPGDLCMLYLGRGRPDQWQLPISAAISPPEDVCFLRGSAMLNMVGYAIRTRFLGTLYDFTTHPGPGRGKVELAERVSRWAVKNRKGFYYARPSIVDHRDGPPVIPDEQREDGQSRAVAPHPSGTATRKAWLFDARPEWNSSWNPIPDPDLRRKDKISRRPLSLTADAASASLGGSETHRRV